MKLDHTKGHFRSLTFHNQMPTIGVCAAYGSETIKGKIRLSESRVSNPATISEPRLVFKELMSSWLYLPSRSLDRGVDTIFIAGICLRVNFKSG